MTSSTAPTPWAPSDDREMATCELILLYLLHRPRHEAREWELAVRLRRTIDEVVVGLNRLGRKDLVRQVDREALVWCIGEGATLPSIAARVGCTWPLRR